MKSQPTTKPFLILLVSSLLISSQLVAQTRVTAGRRGEIFRIDTLMTGLRNPWEILYAADDSLWVTESSAGSGSGSTVTAGTTGYKVYKVNPVTGGSRVLLDLTSFTDPASSPTNKWQKKFTTGLTVSPQPYNKGTGTYKVPSYQGGLMGLVLHPEFFTNPAKQYVYLSYGHDYVRPDTCNGNTVVSTTNPLTGEKVKGNLFFTWLVRFEYTGGLLKNPVAICDSLPGSNDHNSGRMIIRYDEGTPYLYYAIGDMGAGQFANGQRTNKAQNLNSYEGKILRFNLEPDGDAGSYDRWIPNDNPFNATLGKQSAIYLYGIRNNQGFALGIFDGVEKLFGTSHGPHSDDELNEIKAGKNYGHPLVEGYAADDNYNNSSAGFPGSSLPVIISESGNAAAMGAAYQDPLFSAYAPPAGDNVTPNTVNYIYNNAPPNGTWPSEGWSGLDIYDKSAIPGWKNSFLAASLKWGRLVRIKSNADGTAVESIGGQDTVSLFGGRNRYRDLAISPDGKTIFVVMDYNATTSGPSEANPVVPTCAGCVQRYEFLGYENQSGVSTIPTDIELSAGIADSAATFPEETINAENNDLWVPITDSSGNLIAEINAQGNDLGAITGTLYLHTGTIRTKSSNPYLDRSFTIHTENAPLSPVMIRLYISSAELNKIIATSGSGVNDIGDLLVYKNDDPTSKQLINKTGVSILPSAATAFGANYVLTISVSSFSSFYLFSSSMGTLPIKLKSFSAARSGADVLLSWQTSSEQDMDYYTIERSLDGAAFAAIGRVSARNETGSTYLYTDQQLPAAAGWYYRLKMTGRNGESQYSDRRYVASAVISQTM